MKNVLVVAHLSLTASMKAGDLGLRKTAMGKSLAASSLLMALPETSRMQCLPRSATSFTEATLVPYKLSLYWKKGSWNVKLQE